MVRMTGYSKTLGERSRRMDASRELIVGLGSHTTPVNREGVAPGGSSCCRCCCCCVVLLLGLAVVGVVAAAAWLLNNLFL